MFTKRTGLVILGFVLQLAALFALNDPPVNVNPFITTDNVFVGQQKVPVKVFRINGGSSSAGNKIYLVVKTTYSSDVPYGDKGISAVDIVPGVDYNDGLGGSTPLSGSRISDSEYLFVITQTATTNYLLRYTISPKAKYSLTGGTEIYTDAVLASVRENVDDEEIIVESSSNRPIKINANGLVYKPDSLKSMLPNNSNGVPADITFAIMQFTLRAENSDVGIKSLSLGSTSNFATSTANRDENVRRIVLLADAGDGDYAGLDGETLVCDTGLLSYDKNFHTKEAIALPFNQTITLSAYSENNGVPNTPLSEKIFYVLYELGPGFPTDKTLTCQLIGGSGSFLDGSASSLQLSSSLNVTVVCKLADAWLLSSTARVNIPATVLAGQRGVRMIDFSYKVPDTHETIKNVSIEVTNGGGTFRRRTDDGVNRALLYKYPPSNFGQQTPSLAGIGEVVDNKTVVFRNQTLEPGPNQYYVAYDVGVLVTGNMSAQAQVVGISASANSNLSFWSPVAPPGQAFVHLYPNRALIGPIRVVDGQDNGLNSISPGQSFVVYVPIYNVYSQVALPPGVNSGRDMEVFYDPLGNMHSTRPVFYAGSDFNSTSTERTDISHEFSWTPRNLFGTTFNISSIYTLPRVVTFDVTASNLKTNGTVYVDAQVLYNVYSEDNAYMYGSSTAPPASHHAYYDENMIFRSASTSVNAGLPLPSLPGYVTLQLNGSSSAVPSTSWPSYILPGGISFANANVGFAKTFVNGDKIPLNSSLTISLNAEAEAHLNYDFQIYQNDIPLKKDTDWSLDVSNAVIYLPERNFSAVSAGTQGVLRIAPVNKLNNNDVIPEITIKYELIAGGTLEIKEILPYPTPYEPDAGPLYVGFENDSMDSGAVTVYIYDVTGREVYREEELKVLPGYNTYAWAGDFSSGGKVGRGVYVLRMVFKGSGKRHEVVTRFGVR